MADPLLLAVLAPPGMAPASAPGLRVQAVHTQGEARAALANTPPDLVLVDADLPDGQAFALCQELQGGDAPVVMLVPAGHQNMIDRAYQNGAFVFEAKPLDWDAAIPRLVQVLRVNRALRRWQTEANRLEQTQRIAKVPTWHYDADHGMLRCSEELRRLYQFPPEETSVTVETFLGRVHPEDRPRVRECFERALLHRQGYNIAYRLELPDGKVKFVDEQAELIPLQAGAATQGKARGVQFVAAVRDVSDWLGSNERIHTLANYDGITSLPNRALFLDRLAQALAQARRSDWKLGVVMLDMDRFRELNLTFGHSAGDRALKEVADRLRPIVRTNDTLARMAGDEFCMLLVDLKGGESAAVVAEKVMAALRIPVQLGGQDVPIGASLGITIYPDDGMESEDLMRNVESAVSSVKQAGRGAYRFYTAAMNVRAAERLTLTSHLRGALEREEFVLHYHPLVDVAKGHVAGVEALLRWQNPRQGLLGPDRFIGILEETGLILSVGEWAMNHAAKQLRQFTPPGAPPIRLCVNLSTRQFQRADLVASVANTLKESGIAPEQLELEITESLLMQDMESAIEKLHALRDLGVSLSIDDFGTGFSSLSYLSRFPLTTLKIDKSFIRHIVDRPNDQAIAKSIIALARSLKLRVVVEGVEVPAQLEFFRAYGCDEVQGYLFSQPMDVKELTAWLKHPPVPARK
ncbi:MAG TPA: EAL domain-containing protein [bacterium]